MTKTAILRKSALMLAVAALTACAGTNQESRPARTTAMGQADVTATEEIVVSGNRADVSASYEQAAQTRSGRAHYVAGKALAMPAPACCPRAPTEPIDHENYAHYDDNPVRLASERPVSTFSIDVDTGSYANVRRFLTDGQLPPRDAVRVEELINYFSYDYPTPRERSVPFSIITELAPTPWNADTLLLHVGLKGLEVPARQRPPANLVFLVDVSGSMRSPDKLPLLKDALKMLTRHLDARDTISIAGYAGGAGLILEPTSGADERRIVDALERLAAAGRTNGAAGIHLAYELAQRGFIEGGINRVVLATDGDFNVGTVSFEALVDLVERQREHGVELTALGFGTGNYNDKLLEQIADAGNGNYAYIDSRREARKVLVEQMSSTLHTIARDVKIQIEFNPAMVAEYRLIGYENRMLRREDFNNDQVDAGEIGAGHTVTALYEVTLAGSPARLNDPLRYGADTTSRADLDDELLFVRLRYKHPGSDRSELVAQPVTMATISAMGRDFSFAAAVAAFGQHLRGGDYLAGFELGQIAALAEAARGRDLHGYRREFVDLVEQASALGEALADEPEQDHHYHAVN